MTTPGSLPAPAAPIDGCDYHRIYRRLALFDFAWEIKMGLNLAFYRSFGIASIGSLLAQTGEVTQRAQKRADDTGLLMYELIFHGPQHPRGREVIRRLNQIHRRHASSGADYLYVLATLAVVPTRWIGEHGPRALTPQERHATYLFYRELGRRMNVPDIPGSYDHLATFLDRYERSHLAPHPAGPALHAATRQLLADRFPRWARPAARAFGDALLDPPLRRALGARHPGPLTRAGVRLLLHARAVVARRRPSPAEPAFWPGATARTYPDGYTIAALGPASAAHADEREDRTPPRPAGPSGVTA